MSRLKDLRDGIVNRVRDFSEGWLIGLMFGVVASATYLILWWAMDILMAHTSPAEVLGWSAIACGMVAGGLSVAGGER